MTLQAQVLTGTWPYIYSAPWRLQTLDFHQLACGQLDWTRS